MPDFLQALHSGRVLLMDGAMGTQLQRAGIESGACYELWNLTHPERIAAIHRAYADAGAVCLLTNTFQANPAALARHGCADRLDAILGAGVALARAAGPERFVLADIGPVEQPQLHVTRELVRPLCAADGILIETCSDGETLRAVLPAVRAEVGPRHPPVLLSLTYLRTPDGELRTFTGLSPEEGARQGEALGAVAVGVNCGREIGVADCAEIVRRYQRVTSLPLFARPNAGTPTRTEEGFVYPHQPRKMAAGLAELRTAGAVMVGGCCGTTPEHIREMATMLREAG